MEPEGFYDGNGVYKIRFSPDTQGNWTYVTQSNRKELNGITGSLTCVKPQKGNHGPVSVRNTFHFEYADGTPHYSFGTTCYAWINQPPGLQEQTLRTLKKAPFNKLRMCVFPKNYRYSRNNPPLYPFEGKPGKWELNRPNVRFYRHLEKRVGQLRDMGIEADIILFHPYDYGKWGFDAMDRQADTFYLRYIIARLAAFRNVWWSMANEYDLFKTKTVADFDYIFQTVQAYDPYQRLRSNHNCREFYDHGKAWVTHCSIQHSDLERCLQWRDQYRKPVVIDECRYEGNIPFGWGNIMPETMVKRFWDGFCRGSYVGHGETYQHPKDILWWSKGGVLHGKAPARIAFLRKIIENIPVDMHEQVEAPLIPKGTAIGKKGKLYLVYFGDSQPATADYRFPQGERYRAEVIDTWNMKIYRRGILKGQGVLKLLGKPYTALRLTRV
jgi:hypothetical protein